MNTKKTKDNVVTSVTKYVVNYPKLVVTVSLLMMLVLFTALPTLTKDTRSDAFLAKDNPALVYKDKVKEKFGLSDPIVIAVTNDSEFGVFNPNSLELIRRISEEVSGLSNINADRVTSLSTENNITGTDEGMEVDPFYEDKVVTQSKADAVWNKVSDFPLYMGNLVAHNKQATLIVAELDDEMLVEETYKEVLKVINQTAIGGSEKIYVAGEGAIAGYLGSYIDEDAQILNPIAGIIITMIILFAFRRFSPGLLSNVIIAASVLMTLSIMALFEVPFFVITNALPVILIGISVADSIHIYSHYFELQARHPEADKNALIVSTVEAMWRPITLTTLTTIAGFMGLYFAAYMPPFQYFGLYTAVGVGIAWLYSLVFLPAAMALIKPSASKQMVALSHSNQQDGFSKVMVALGRVTLNNSKRVIVVFSAIIISGLFAATQLTVNEDRINTFHSSEPLHQADKVINTYFNGTNNLDVVIESSEEEGLFNPAYLKKMERLQEYALSLDNVEGATSIVDYLKQMNRSLNGGAKESYVLPTDKNLIAQYFLIYSASSDPTDFEEEVGYEYRVANIRLTMNKGGFVDTKGAVSQLNEYIKSEFNEEGLTATLSGRVNVNYHWIKDLGESHFVGLLVSLFLVWAVSALLFGSMVAALFAITPVAVSLLLVYSAMVVLKIDLGIGTSMFASVAIGLGVDFAIHTLDRLRSLFKQNAGDWDASLTQLYPLTGRALFFNYLAIACGFGVLISSKVVPLNDFGIIVVVSVTTSFLASMSFLPALIKVVKPRFIAKDMEQAKGATEPSFAWAKVSLVLVLVGLLGTVFISEKSHANEPVGALSVVSNINAVDDGEYVTRDLEMRLIDKRGKTRVRQTVGFRKYFNDEKRTILFYKKPTNVKGTAFLTFDYPSTEVDDDQWLYLPALRKVRRISASDRGDYFLGTDFTFEDIKLESKLDTSDYEYTVVEQIEVDSKKTLILRGVPKSNEIAKELGYSRVESTVDVNTWVVVKSVFWDVKGQLLKTLIAKDIRLVDGILTRHELSVDNHKTGHRTEFLFSNVDYRTQIKDGLFSKRAMKKGK